MDETTTTDETTEAAETTTEETTEAASTTETGEKPAPTQADIDKAYAKLRDTEERLKEAAKAEKELKKLKDAEKTDLERAQARADEAEAKEKAATDRLRRANLLVALTDKKYELVSAEVAADLIRGVDFDENDAPTNLDAKVEELVGKHEFLKGTPAKPAAPSLDGKEGGETPPPALTAEELKFAESMGLTAEEYAANKT